MTEPGTPVRKLSLAELEPTIREAFAAGMAFKLPVTGTSNLPTLKPGRDEFVLEEAVGPLKKGDLPLYRRQNGQYVLHRVVALGRDGTYVCCGDHQSAREPGIRPEQIVGVTALLIRKGKQFPVTAFPYRLWVRLWVLLLPCRRTIFRICNIPGRLSRCFSRHNPN